MQIQFLGTGAGMPSKFRNTSSLVVKLMEEIGECWLFDCGEATQHQIIKTSIKPRKITKIFITHLHGDHIYGLPGFLGSRSFLGGDEDLTIYGPTGLQQWVEASLKVTGTYLTYTIHFVELSEGLIFENDSFIVETLKLQHVVECYGFRVQQKALAGKLDIEKARLLGVPNGPQLGQLKNGQDILLQDGTLIESTAVLSEPQPGFILSILGDTKYCANAITLSKNADVVIHEATFDKNTAQLAASYGHSTNREAAMVAKEAQAQLLLMNHISARFMLKDLALLQSDAQCIFPQSFIVQDLDAFDWKNQYVTRIASS